MPPAIPEPNTPARRFYPHASIARHDPFRDAIGDDSRFALTVEEAERRWRALVA